MKKILILTVLLLAAGLPLFASDGIVGVGVEAGYPYSGVTVDFSFNEKWGGYVTAGYGYGYSGFLAIVGSNVKVAEIELNNTNPININVGVQGVLPLTTLFRYGLFSMAVHGTVGASYDFEEIPLTAYIRSGFGVVLAPVPGYGIICDFSWDAVLGAVYHF